jgi:hypothetical protein
MEAINKPRSSRSIPLQSWVRRYPASRSRPLSTPTNINVNVWIEPIHEIVDGLVPGKRAFV